MSISDSSCRAGVPLASLAACHLIFSQELSQCIVERSSRAPSSSARRPGCPFSSTRSPTSPTTCATAGRWTAPGAGWFFDHAAEDDWGCGWAVTDQKNMGQVVHHPLADWAKLDAYRPPDPRDPYYFERLEDEMADAEDRYVVVTSHFNLIERLHMLHGFSNTLTDLYLEPPKIERVLDMILDFKLAHVRRTAPPLRRPGARPVSDRRLGHPGGHVYQRRRCSRPFSSSATARWPTPSTATAGT